MARSYLTPINLNQLEIQNVRLQNLASAPSSPVVGQFYYDTALGASYVWNGTVWRSLDATKLTGVIPLAALATDPLARANHTGTQAAATIIDLATVVKAYKLNEFAAPVANIPMAGFTLTGLPAPAASGQAAEYSWVIGQIQSAAAGITSRPAVRVVAVANSALSGLLTVDGVTLVAGDRVLAVAQTAAAQNGVYIVASGAWTRATAEDQSTEMSAGSMWLATEGTSNSGTQWRQATTGAITLGTTSLSIVQFGAGATYTNGNGILLTGSAFSVNVVAGGGITVGPTGIALDLAVASRKFSATIGDGTATSFTVTHNLNTQDVVMFVRQAGTPFAAIECDMSAATVNTATIAFATAPASGAYRVTVVG